MAGVRDVISAAELRSPLSALIPPLQSGQEAMGPAQGCAVGSGSARWLLYSFQCAEVKGDGPGAATLLAPTCGSKTGTA